MSLEGPHLLGTLAMTRIDYGGIVYSFTLNERPYVFGLTRV